MQPVYFGSADVPGIFGWLHNPGAGGPLGLVVCSPFGFEEVCAHRPLRELAERAGVPALRFDFAGCGNSHGDETDPGQLGRWVASVHEAAQTLKRTAGVTRIAFLGVRLGAALAALAAAERDDVVGLIALAPVWRGRSYLRELALLGGNGAPGPDGLESAGFVMSAETVAELGRLDLRRLATRPAPAVVVIERDDVPGQAAEWVSALQSQGVDVSVPPWPGYAGMQADPQRSRVPEAMVEGVARLLARWRGPAAAARCDLAPQPPLAQYGNERAVHIPLEGGGALFGVLHAAARPPGERRPAVLMLNAGGVHHIGPNRLWVRLGRSWSRRGIAVLRVDLSGLGDSLARPRAAENVVYPRHAADDLAAALHFLRAETGATECHAMGLCSGAYHALSAALEGQGWASAMMVNPLTFVWPKGFDLAQAKDYELDELSARYRARVFHLQSWRRLARGDLDLPAILNVVRRRLAGALWGPLQALARRLHLPLRNDLARRLTSAVQSGVLLHFVFAARSPGLDLLRRQVGQRELDSVLGGAQASLDILPDADHTFTRSEARERLVGVLEARLAATLAPPLP